MKRIFRLPDEPRRVSRDVNRELELHLELRAREFEAQGMPPDDARRAALEAATRRNGSHRPTSPSGGIRIGHSRGWRRTRGGVLT